MKKGSQARKCCKCGRRIFWLIPVDDKPGIFHEVTIKREYPSMVYKGRYWCRDCYDKAISEGCEKHGKEC